MSEVKLYGRVILSAEIEAVTGLHIGGSNTGMEIGGLDKAVIRNPLNNQPYIPGSSLRGKMRSQTEKVLGLPQNNRIGQVTIHTCKKIEDYEANGGCKVCHVFGVPAEQGYPGSTRLVVRDVRLTDESAKELDKLNTDLRFAEVKTEVAIDRVTSMATPRMLERVPAGAVFGPAELVFNIYEQADFARLSVVVDALKLVEDDYLGGSGSRGSGKVQFRSIHVTARSHADYGREHVYPYPDGQTCFAGVQDLSDAFGALQAWLSGVIRIG